MKGCSWLGCSKQCEGTTDYCATHNREMRKIGEQIVKNIQKNANKKPVNKVSDKRKEQNKEYFKLVEQFKIDNPDCKAKINEYCTGKTDDPHHSRGRGKYLLDVSTWVPVCRSCHIYIGDHHAEAVDKGLSYSRLAKDDTES